MSSFYKITKRKIAYDYGTISPAVYEILPYTNNNFVQFFEYTKGNYINNKLSFECRHFKSLYKKVKQNIYN